MVQGLNNSVKGLLIFCAQCGESEFTFHDYKKKAGKIYSRVSCASCGAVKLVEGANVFANFVTDDLSMKMYKQNATVPPPEMKDEAKPKERPEKDNDLISFTVKLTAGQRDFVREVFDLVRAQAGWEGKAWNGAALECVCAEYMAGNQNAPQKIDYSDLETATGKKLDSITIATFSRMLKRMFPDADQQREWVKQNMPQEYILRKAEEPTENIEEITNDDNESADVPSEG